MGEQEIRGLIHGRAFGATNSGVDLSEGRLRDGPREGGIDRAVADRAHDETGGSQLLSGDASQCFDGGFASDIGGFAFKRKRHSDGGEVDDAAGALADHDLTDSLQTMEGAEVVDAHEPLGGLAGRQQQSIHGRRAGIIHQEIDAATFGDGRDGTTDRRLIRDVDGMAMKIRMTQGLRATGETMHGPTVREQAFGQGTAETLGSAGDESGVHFRLGGRVDQLIGWPVGRTKDRAKVQIGAELRCKSAKVNNSRS